ncbi:MAG: oligoendopeptidase F [Parachlamydiales bacterium]|nr:oligoendopeptidase F [Verrucomicrobiota bacterium]MBX3720118.1 oligoendopeptidase F [Candidatus Acheromyda pituitae]
MSAAEILEPEERTRNREEIPVEDRWDVEALYPSWESWEEGMKLWGREKSEPHWPEIAPFRSQWSQSPVKLRELIELLLTIDRELTKLYTYAHLRHDEDVGNDAAKGAYSRIMSLLYSFRQETAWVEPEILQLSDDKLKQLIDDPALAPYKLHLEKIVRQKPHTLSAQEEELLALCGNSLETAQKAFGALNNADLKFSPVADSKGKEKELTHGKYQLYLRDKDRKVREGAFKNLHQAFSSHENTICELINGQIQRHLLEMRARKFSSCLEAALFPHQIDTSVYTALIQAVRKHLPSLHHYVSVRKKLMGVPELHLYDLYAPLVNDVDMGMSYPEASQQIIDSVAILGKSYQESLRKGLTSERWVDRYENIRKRSGAYSSGCYDSMPYILMNYHGSYNDVMTLTHEAGHSMHSLLSRTHQPYQYAQYSIFVAEVASTFHEELLFRHLLAQTKTTEQKAFLINQKIDDMRATLLRQTMFAEFELQLHEWAQKGVPFTPALLKDAYLKLNREYFGNQMCVDSEVEIEWARIPHFYYNFYVYQYATGISAAHALAEHVVSGKEGAKEKYLQFLSAGCSLYPIDVLNLAGVDMRTSEPVEAAMRRFKALVDELENLLS